MNSAARMIRPLLPPPLRQFLRQCHREWTFRRTMAVFLKDPLAATEPGSPVLARLVYGWGNEAWSALQEYLAASLRHAAAARGPILECGSGLTTLLVGVVARRAGLPLWSLEHTPAWGERVRRELEHYGLDNVHLRVAPLRDYAGYAWYDPPLAEMPDSFSLVVCDGPPAATQGGRYGLLPVMGKRFAPDCVVLLDDGGRPDEQAIARRWQAEAGGDCEIEGRQKPYIRLRLKGPA